MYNVALYFVKELGFSADTYIKRCQTSKIEHFAKIINGFQPVTNFTKLSILDFCQSSGYVTRQICFKHQVDGWEMKVKIQCFIQNYISGTLSIILT